MRKLFTFNLVSLDGYFSRTNGDLDWHHVDAEFNEFAIAQINEIGTLVFGRITYEFMAKYWPTDAAKQDDPVIADKMNSLPKLVASHTLTQASWENSTIVKDDIGGSIAKLKEEAGGNIAIFGSSALAVSLLQMGLIDECRTLVNPVLLGAGHSLFAGLDRTVELELVDSRSFSNGNVLLVHRPVKN